MKATMRLVWLFTAYFNLLGLLAEAAQCDFCTRGEITEPNKTIAIPGYEFLGSCGIVDTVAAPSLLASDIQYQQLQVLLGSYCGCPPADNACTLCPDGSPVPDEYRDKELTWLTEAFEGNTPTCQILEAVMSNDVAGAESCTSLQIISAACGCPALPDHCVYCPGETLQPEYYDTELPFVGSEELGITGTCEIYWYSQYQIQEHDIQCDQSSFLTFHCGCNGGLLSYWGSENLTQQIAMVWIPRVVGSLSFIAASLVLVHILRNKKKRSSVYHQMVVLIAIFDIVTAWVFIVGAAAVEEMNPETSLTHGIYGAHGNEASCKASGFFYHLGFTSVYLNVSLTTYFLLVIVYGLRETRLKQLRLCFFGPPLALGFGLSFASIPFILVSWNHCQADNNPWGDTLWSLLLFHMIPLIGATAIILCLLLFLYLKVRHQFRKTRDKQLRTYSITSKELESTEDSSIASNNLSKPPARRRRRSSTRLSVTRGKERKNSLEREVFWVCVSYAAAFGITWPIIIVGQFQGVNFDLPFWFWVIVVTVSPAQGLSNTYCYFRPHLRARLRKKRRAQGFEEDEPQGCVQSTLSRGSKYCTFLCCNICSKRPSGEESSVQEGVEDPTDALAQLSPEYERSGDEGVYDRPTTLNYRRTIDEEILDELDNRASSS